MGKGVAYLLYVNYVIIVLGELGTDLLRVGGLVSRDLVAVEEFWQACDVHAQDVELAASGCQGAAGRDG